MQNYFLDELRSLKAATKEFAQHHPESDPYIDRLLEGTAFLTSKIRQKLADDLPEIAEALLTHLWPQLLRPLPSTTIMEFRARPGQLQQTYTLQPGTVVTSQPVGSEQEAIGCKFRTINQLQINPLHISQASISETSGSGSIIKLLFQLDAGADLTTLNLTDLTLFLHADFALASQLHYALTVQCKKISLQFPELTTQQPITLANQQFQPGNLASSSIISPNSGRSFCGLQLLHEYFLVPEKYLFVTLPKLNQINWPQQCQQFMLTINSNQAFPANCQISKTNFRLHCTPAVNLFEQTSEPININQRQYEYPLIIDNEFSDSIKLYSLNRVNSLNKESEQLTNDFHLAWRQSITNQLHPYLILTNPSLTAATLSCDITASNGNYPQQYLQAGQINIPSNNIPNCLQLQNLTRPTQQYLPPSRKFYQWTLLTQLAINYQTITKLENLQQLLNLYDWAKTQGNQQHIAAIYALEVNTANKIEHGIFSQGLEFNLKIEQTAFDSLAEINLFGLILHQFFTMHAVTNFFVTTRINCHPSNQELTWQSPHGDNLPS